MERTPVSFGPGVFLFGGNMQNKVFTTKVFTTYDQQIEILKNRGVQIVSDSDLSFAYEVLQKVGYYGLINGYKEPFLDKQYIGADEHYKPGTTLQEIHALYEFDRNLRDTFMSFILKFETHVKSTISYVFSEAYGYDNYLLYKNFDTTSAKANEYISELISEINRQIASRTKDPCISHYLNNYGYIPLWVLNNILTFGTVSKFYSLMKLQEKTKVSRIFKIQPHDLENFLKYLSSVRNFCAHGNRVFCYRSNAKTLNDTVYHSNLQIPKRKDNYVLGKKDLFAAMIALRIVLSNNDYSRLKRKLKKCITILSKQINTLSASDILSEMGFPTNWTNL